MKRKINFKLTFTLVSLFIGFLLVVLGNKNKYCLSFGFIFLAIALIIYIVGKYQQINKALIEIESAIDQAEVEDFDLLTELSLQKRTLKRQKGFTCTMCIFFAVLLIVFGFVNLF